MGYRSFMEYIDEDGFYWMHEEPYYGDVNPERNNPNGKPPVWERTIVVTNGVDENDPTTMPGPKKSLGFKDIWHVDHYGNKYATKHECFEVVPVPGEYGHWIKYATA